LVGVLAAQPPRATPVYKTGYVTIHSQPEEP